MTLTAHVASRIAEHRAKKAYQEFMTDAEEWPEKGIGYEIRLIVGVWGCLFAVLEFLREMGELSYPSIGSVLDHQFLMKGSVYRCIRD